MAGQRDAGGAVVAGDVPNVRARRLGNELLLGVAAIARGHQAHAAAAAAAAAAVRHECGGLVAKECSFDVVVGLQEPGGVNCGDFARPVTDDAERVHALRVEHDEPRQLERRH